MTVKTYHPKQVIVTFRGLILTEFAQGTFVSVKRDDDAVKKYVGAQGDVSRAINANRAGTVTITLAQTSPSNSDLQTAAKLDELAGTGKGPLSVTDLGGGLLAHAEDAWVKKQPDRDYGQEIGPREWVFDTGPLDISE